MNGLSAINVELTSRCQKNCWMCGRRKIEREYPHLAEAWGDMPLEMVRGIATQVPPGVFVQLHNNGEPLLYPELKAALQCFSRHNTGFDTNGKLMAKRIWDIVGQIDTITLSVIQEDPEGWPQLHIFESFLKDKGDRRPLVVIRLLGEIGHPRMVEINAMAKHYGCLIARRQLHSPDGSRGYEKPVTIPEIGVCLEMLHKLSIDRYGNVSPCVRFDPERLGFMGTLAISSLKDIWTSPLRRDWINLHLAGKRNDIPFCAKCDYWGIPRG